MIYKEIPNTVRVIYMIEKIGANGCESRRYARNMKTAEKIAKQTGGEIMKVRKANYQYINFEWIEG